MNHAASSVPYACPFCHADLAYEVDGRRYSRIIGTTRGNVEQGYCNACHWWTSAPHLGAIDPPQERP